MVDDEEEIRKGISRKIDWSALGFQLVGEAENGADALELAEQLRPDVVLTDIKMPFMDGLTLCRHLQSLLPATQLVVFSGFDDFELARQAIGLHVSGYILKPINASELSEVLESLRRQMDAQRDERQNVEALRRRYEESLPVMRELFFSRLLDGWIKPDQVRERAARYDISLPNGRWTVALIQVGENGDDSGTAKNELTLFSVRAFVSENFSLDGYDIRPVLYKDAVALPACLGQGGDVYRFMSELDRIVSLARSYLGLVLTVGVGRPCEGVETLSQSALQAMSALEYRLLMGPGRVIYLGDLEPDTSVSLSFDEDDERALTSVVKLGTGEQVEDCVARMMRRVGQAGLSLNQCHVFFLELLAFLIRLTRSVNIPQKTVFGEGFSGGVQLTDFHSLKDLEDWCRERFLRLRDALNRQRTDTASNLVEKAKEYIRSNYAEKDLSVETLCSYLHLSPAYFSTVFKRETGTGFAAFVTEVRMEAASRMLRETDDKTYLIAEHTGYDDPNYFSYVFKRHFGMSPSQYRNA